MRRIVWAFALLALAAPAPAAARSRAPLRLHALFSDGAVLQAGMMVPVWGTAEPGEEVTVEFEGQKKAVPADAEGRWRVRLDILSPGGPHELKVSAGGRSVVARNILVGEVWLAGGQSNMEWPVRSSARAEEEIAAARHPRIRLFTVPRRASEAPQRDVEGAWKECSPESVAGFSAVAYFFGRELHQALGVPVGLIHASWGGTPAEVWTRREVFDEVPELKECVAEDARRRAAHEKAAEQARAKGKLAPRAPLPLSSLYNGMIAPLIPYGLRGAIWYQGESNASRAALYRTLFPALIRTWRRDWGQGDFPFLFVQLANFMARRAEPSESAWAELREAQLRTLSEVPRTAMAVAIDLGEEKDIHPRNKQDVGRRLARAALGTVYDRAVVYSGPLYDGMKVEEDRIRVFFKHVGGGLEARGGKLAGFAVAGADRKFVWAEAEIDGETVVVRHPSVPAPVAVRYAWADNPEATLYNKEGLPASPFRTDDWPRAR